MRTTLAAVAAAAICAIASLGFLQLQASPILIHHPRHTKHAAAFGGAPAKTEAKRLDKAGGVTAVSSTVAENPQTPDGGELQKLACLVGEWSSEDPKIEAGVFYRWSTDRKSLVGDFKVKLPGKPEMSGTQRIAFDPMEHKIRQWVFYDDGGFAEGLWTQSGRGWIVKMSGVDGAGRYLSATQHITPDGDQRADWKATDQVCGDEYLPEVEEMSMVKKPVAADK